MRAFVALFLCCFTLATAAPGAEPLRSFSTNGHTVYQLRCGHVAPSGDSVLMAAALDGTTHCYTHDGKLLWKNDTNRSLPLDLAAADLNGDDRDETLVASADGSLYAFDHAGQLKWQFRKEPPLIQVCAVTETSQGTIILTGGIERKLYALSQNGEVLNHVEFPYPVRHIRSGNFLGDGKNYAAVVTAKNDRSRFVLQLFDPLSLNPIWEKPVGLATTNPTEGTKYYVPWAGFRVTAMSALPIDINSDGSDEILLTDSFSEKGQFYAYNGHGEKILTSSTKGLRGRAYRMNLLTRVTMPDSNEDRIIGLFGNQLIVYDLDGNVEQILDASYSLACAEFDPDTGTLFLGSSISGGDGIYALHLGHPDWESAFQSLKPIGRLAQVEKNLATLTEQIERYQRPTYQRAPEPTTVITGKSADEIRELYLDQHDYKNVDFVQFNLLTEHYDRDILKAPWNTTRETRHRYDKTAKQIVAFAKEREELGEPFALWAGHGNDPFYMQLSTIEAILEAAPTTCRALVFPEMERTDDAMQYAVRTHIVPIAELCRKHGTAKIVLRNKNIFFNASCYLDLWREILLGDKYNDIFIPSMEETNGRTQAISLSGRMGLWLTGHFDRISGRAVTDNANFSRFWEWGAQQNLSHLMRSMVLRTSLGADTLLVNTYQGDPRTLAPLYRMLEKGVIAVPERDGLLSVADLCLGMKQPSEVFLKHGKNGHLISAYQPRSTKMVFDRMDCYWGGAPTDPSDFSNYAMGSRSRMLNFLPTNRYGLIASVPATTDLKTSPFFQSMLVTNGEVFYDDQGQPVSAADYKPTALAALRESAARLPVRVQGEVAWTVVRLDPTHVRVTLIDPGYISPADRETRIVLQHLDAITCRDILSGETLPVEQNAISLTIPAGVLRVVDIAHR
jgi:lambda-carrageenase